MNTGKETPPTSAAELDLAAHLASSTLQVAHSLETPGRFIFCPACFNHAVSEDDRFTRIKTDSDNVTTMSKSLEIGLKSLFENILVCNGRCLNVSHFIHPKMLQNQENENHFISSWYDTCDGFACSSLCG